MPVDGPLKKRTAVRTRRYVQDHRYAGLTGSISQPVTEFTYDRKRQRPLPPGPRPVTPPPPPGLCNTGAGGGGGAVHGGLHLVHTIHMTPSLSAPRGPTRHFRAAGCAKAASVRPELLRKTSTDGRLTTNCWELAGNRQRVTVQPPGRRSKKATTHPSPP